MSIASSETVQDDGWPAEAPLRPPAQVMRLARMGCSFPTRLSFSRSLIRALADEAAKQPEPLVRCERWEIDDDGYGRAVYSLPFAGRTYSLVAFSSPLEPEQRTDRVIAVAWDSAFVLFDGVPTEADVDRLAANVPRQEAGRMSANELTLSRANKSVRFFEHVVERLAVGQQPDPELLNSIGYLMRTTAVYSNGKFGLSDRAKFADRQLMSDPFRAEMLTVWLIRIFTVDLVEYVARRRAPSTATTLDPTLRRHLGIGNSTGLGMAPFLVDHPVLINNWVLAKETALARVLAVDATAVTSDQVTRLISLVERATRHLSQWNTQDVRLTERLVQLREEVEQLTGLVGNPDWPDANAGSAWQQLFDWSQAKSMECQELVVALLIELHPELADGLTGCMEAGLPASLDPSMSTVELTELLERDWNWALSIDFTDRTETTLFWYTSEERLEPRIGDRYQEDGAELERPLDIARRVSALQNDLSAYTADPETSTTIDSGEPAGLARFLMRHPEHRMAVQRVQLLARHPYGEIQDNLLCVDCLPIDMLRWKLAFFGASKFDPKSNLWTRITLFQGAPFPDELAETDEPDDWWLPVLTG